MKTLIIVTLMIFQVQLGSQQSPNLVGNWTFHKFETTETIEEDAKTVLTKILSTINYDFKSDGTYDFQRKGKKESGTWKSDKQFITTTKNSGYSESIKYIQKHKDTLRLELEKNQYAVFVRK